MGPAQHHPTEVSAGRLTLLFTSGFQIVQIPFYSVFLNQLL